MTSTTFKWQTTETSFGGISRPMAIIGLRNSKGTWQQFTFKIDTGADMTGMNASDCDLLGYDLEKGERMAFDGIGGSQAGYIHKIDLQIGSNVVNKVPIVFFKKPISELLLGRHTVFHNYEVLFKGKILQTDFLI